jgi:transketolase
VGSLAGVLPGGPGHSHQSVRDITAMSAMPGLTIIEPNSELQVSDALKWALYENDKSTYIRLTSIHFENNSMLSNLKLYNYGEGELLTEGQDLTIICYNPVLCLEVLKLLSLSEYKTNSIELISMPWINKFNVQWLSKTLNSKKSPIIVLENHYQENGCGSILLNIIKTNNIATNRDFHIKGIIDVPKCGTNQEVLNAHGLDSKSLAILISSYL